ncbi:hypothetical protein IMSAG249_00423 [Lachnospiraceae bacterium]|jgi:hypothetical protein|nr:hypothetical protein [Lachnospiraceae bacterium]GFI68606.1 hypothetical protein IMSAG249_00423 [Lachnospiraceae bacterium]
MSESMFIRLFAGVSSDYFDIIPLVPFGQWLLPIGIFLLTVSVYVERDRKAETFSLYRYETVLACWTRHFVKRVIAGIRTAGLLLFIVLTFDFVMGKLILLSVELLAKISVLWLFHSISLAALFVLLDLFPVRRFVPGMLFLLEGITFIVGCRIRAVSHVMYGMWGMYLRSSLHETGGFPAGVIIVTEAVLLAASFVIGREYLKKETDYI